MAQHVPIIFGGGGIGNYAPFDTEEGVKALLDTLKKVGVNHIDAAQIYGRAEEALGIAKAGDSFTIDTKWLVSFDVASGVMPAWATHEYMATSSKESLARLGVNKVNIFYIHGPDRKTPFEETMAGVDEAYKAGRFEKFGLSNFTAEEVQKIYDIATAKGYVKPVVYQGNYSAAARRSEKELLPTLRKLGIAYYAYSPIAGGLLAKTPEQVEAGAGRFNSDSMVGGLYSALYKKPEYIEALRLWGKAAEEEGVTRAELAFRWVASNSALDNAHGDAVIIGASNYAQLEQTVAWIQKGRLSAKAVKTIDEFWAAVEKVAPLNNF